jgi:hypothetical protein
MTAFGRVVKKRSPRRENVTGNGNGESDMPGSGPPKTRAYSESELLSLHRLLESNSDAPEMAVSARRVAGERRAVEHGGTKKPLPETEILDSEAGSGTADSGADGVYRRLARLAVRITPFMRGIVAGASVVVLGIVLLFVARAGTSNSSAVPERSAAWPATGVQQDHDNGEGGEPNRSGSAEQPENPHAVPPTGAQSARNDGNRKTNANATTPAVEKEAAELLITGRYREALEIYRELAGQRTESPVFAVISGVLAHHIEERCKQEAVHGGYACAASE